MNEKYILTIISVALSRVICLFKKKKKSCIENAGSVSFQIHESRYERYSDTVKLRLINWKVQLNFWCSCSEAFVCDNIVFIQVI